MSNEGKPIQVEPAPEGPLVKPKRPMTEAQLEALKRGRAKLAEKRKAAEEAKSVQSVSEEPVKYGLDEESSDSDSESEPEQDAQDEAEERVYCSVM